MRVDTFGFVPLSSNNILWSWHLWITDLVTLSGSTITPVSDITFPAYNSVNGYPGNIANIMNRNLGAHSAGNAITPANNANTDTYGLLYQWGRKDPFPGSSVYNTDTESTIYTPLGSGQYGSGGSYGQKLSTKGTMDASIQSPLNYYGASGFDWVSGTHDGKNNRWIYINTDPAGTGSVYNKKGDIKTIYDPCPKGYRVPWGNNWSDIQTTNTNNTTNFPWQAILGSYGGCIWKPRTDNRNANTTNTTWRWIPATGYRDNSGGGLGNVGSAGYYWSGSPGSTTSGYSLIFSSGIVYPSYGTNRTFGFSVRCVQE